MLSTLFKLSIKRKEKDSDRWLLCYQHDGYKEDDWNVSEWALRQLAKEILKKTGPKTDNETPPLPVL